MNKVFSKAAAGTFILNKGEPIHVWCYHCIEHSAIMENGKRVWKAYETLYVDGEDFKEMLGYQEPSDRLQDHKHKEHDVHYSQSDSFRRLLKIILFLILAVGVSKVNKSLHFSKLQASTDRKSLHRDVGKLIEKRHAVYCEKTDEVLQNVESYFLFQKRRLKRPSKLARPSEKIRLWRRGIREGRLEIGQKN